MTRGPPDSYGAQGPPRLGRAGSGPAARSYSAQPGPRRAQLLRQIRARCAQLLRPGRSGCAQLLRRSGPDPPSLARYLNRGPRAKYRRKYSRRIDSAWRRPNTVAGDP